ncbi:MAG: LysE family translocator [Roseivivax sp.]|nr:LysE family translocator [Roseivivax sp.]
MEFAPFLPGFIAAYSILFVAASSPGPAVAMILGIATGQGRAGALVAALGIATGSLMINLATLFGVGLLLAEISWAMMALRVIGAGYLLWLARGAFRKALNPPPLFAAELPAQRPAQLFLKGLLLQVTNPKAIVFWLAITSIGATKGGGAAIVALFATGAFAISFTMHALWGVVLSAGPVRAAYRKGRRWIEATLGAFFCFAAFKLATSRG